MALLSLDQLKERIGAPAADAVLTRYLDANNELIIDHLGSLEPQTIRLDGASTFVLLQPAARLLAVDAAYPAADDSASVAGFILADDKVTIHCENPREWRSLWFRYQPFDNTSQRETLLEQLVLLDLQYEGVRSTAFGSVRRSLIVDLPRAKNELINALVPSQLGLGV